MEGVTMQEQVDEISGNMQLVVIGFAGREAHADDRSSVRRAAASTTRSGTSCRPTLT